MGQQFLTAYLVLVNAAALALMLTDKKKARRGAWRIPESTLMTVALVGGSIGAIAGMYLVRHKTRHPKFFIGLPVILTLQIAAILVFITR